MFLTHTEAAPQHESEDEPLDAVEVTLKDGTKTTNGRRAGTKTQTDMSTGAARGKQKTESSPPKVDVGPR
jgi:hypothetical protein